MFREAVAFKIILAAEGPVAAILRTHKTLWALWIVGFYVCFEVIFTLGLCQE